MRRLRMGAVYAPSDGVVITDQPELLIGAQLAAGETALELAEDSGWQASVSISEGDVHALRVGDRAELDVLALHGLREQRLSGRVVAIAARARRENGEGSYAVRIAVDSTSLQAVGPSRLQQGFTVRAMIVTETMPLLAFLWRRLAYQ